MKKFLIDSAELIIYASGVCIVFAGFYTGIQLIRLSGMVDLIPDGPEFGPMVGIFFIVAGFVFAALHCVIWLAVLDIRTYTRYSAKMMNSR